MDLIVNKVASSGLITIDLESWLANKKIVSIDLKTVLWQGLILKEKDARDFLSNYNKASLTGSYVNIYCSEDTVLPQWLYLLVASQLAPHCEILVWGDENELINQILLHDIALLNTADYIDARIVIKGCATVKINPQVYMNLTAKLQPICKSIMYGEPCSTVPIYKQPKA